VSVKTDIKLVICSYYFDATNQSVDAFLNATAMDNLLQFLESAIQAVREAPGGGPDKDVHLGETASTFDNGAPMSYSFANGFL
jgi:hypothetical protein